MRIPTLPEAIFTSLSIYATNGCLLPLSQAQNADVLLVPTEDFERAMYIIK